MAGPLVTAAFGVAGLAVGSFLNVCIHRIPKRVSIVWPASRCARCDRPLAWFENVPIVSYAVLGGRCRTCRARISIQYPLVEAITMAAFVLLVQVFGLDSILIPRLLFACVLIVLFAIDLEHQILPNVITLPGIIVGFLCSFVWPPGLVSSLIGIAIGGGILWLIAEAWLKLRGIEGMGFGDVKMLAMVGAFLGWKMVVLTFVLSSLLGGIVGIIVIASRRGKLATAVPFGTMLAAAAFVASVHGDQLIGWYLGRFAP
jgi:leader peptidase (prepilin peptidase)/N-methyltransferase